MTNKKFDLRQELQSPEARRFEASMTEKYGRQMTIRSTPLVEFVDVASGLLEVKISDLAIEGATDEAGYWRELAYLYPMKAEKEQLAMYSARDFAVRQGKVTTKSKEDSGGKVTNVELDVTDESCDNYIYLAIEGRDIELRRTINIENAARAAGRAFAKHVRDEILKKYIADKATEQALSNTRYESIIKLSAALNKKGYGLNAIIIDADDLAQALTEETAAGNMPWLNAMIAGNQTADMARAGVGRLNGLIGYLGGKVPIYAVGDTSASLNGTILGVDRDKAVVVGLHKDMQLRQDINKLSDLNEAVLAMRYVVKSANTAAIGYVSGA